MHRATAAPLLAALCFIAAGCSSPASGAAREAQVPPGISVSFDAKAASELIQWARSDSSTPPEDWRSEHAYELTRLWAQWNGQADPDVEVEAQLQRLARRKSQGTDSPVVVASEKLLREVLDGQQAFLQSAVRLLSSYLPPQTAFQARVLFALFIPPYSFSWGDGSIVIDLAADYWQGNPDKVLNLIVHELYHDGFLGYQPGTSAADARDGAAIVEHVLWRTQNEGLATYVAYRARTPRATIEDYELLDDAAQVERRFDLLRRLLADAAAAGVEELPALRERTTQVGDMQRAYFVVGAFMARRIEERSGRDVLIGTVTGGPHAFFSAYAATAPAQELSMPLPQKGAK